MREAQGFLLVFSITHLSSLQELEDLREQIQHIKNDPDVPIVLVGNKSDLEDDRKVSRTKAFQVSQSWGNVPYYETSARRRQNVVEVFVDVCRQMMRKDLATKGGFRHGRAPGEEDRRKKPKKIGGDENENDYDTGRKRERRRCVIL